MTIEEKAKAYDEALKKARKLLNEILDNELLGFPGQIREIFPQLRESESEDERIRKGIIEIIKAVSGPDCDVYLDEKKQEKYLAWLEKQKEPKWSPSEGEMGVLYKLCYISNQITDEDDTELTRLYQDLKREYFNGHSFENMFSNERQKESLHIPETCKENADSFTDIKDRNIRGCIGMALADVSESRFKMYGVTLKECLAYLEKQKARPIPDKFSGLKSLMLQYFQSAVHRNDDAEIESDTDLWGRKILDYVWKYSDEQKEQKPWKVGANAYFTPEQKPSDLSEMMVHKEPYIAPVPTPMVAYEQKPDTRDADDLQLLGFIYDLLNEIEWKDNWAMSKDECLRRLNNYRPQKPPEWGEEDSDILRDVICATDILAKDFKKDNPHLAKTLRIAKEWLEALPERFTLAIKKEWDEFDEDCLKRAIWYVENPAPSVVKDTNLALWLKYLPGRFNLQSKPEWSEMDELMMKAVIGILDERDHPKLCSFLKSLPLRCPKSSDNWKPSEEQMEALNKAIPVCMGVVGRDAVAPLESLCEQLERLM